MKKIITILLALSLVLTVACATSANGGYKFSQSASENTNINGGVIRLDPEKGVYLHTNSTHHSVGIEKVYIDKTDGSLVVVRDKDNAVVTTAVTPDKTLSGKGVTVGLSGGGKVSKVFFYKDGKRLKLHYKSNYSLIASSTSDIWFMSITYSK